MWFAATHLIQNAVMSTAVTQVVAVSYLCTHHDVDVETCALHCICTDRMIDMYEQVLESLYNNDTISWYSELVRNYDCVYSVCTYLHASLVSVRHVWHLTNELSLAPTHHLHNLQRCLQRFIDISRRTAPISA